jgi:PAS domain S-box-containing protein
MRDIRTVGWEPGSQTTAVVASDIVQSTMLGELLENARVGAIAIDEGRYVAANAYACELVGYAREELIGRRVGELRPNADLQRHITEVAERSRTAGDLTLLHKDGHEVEVSYRIVPTTLAGLDLFIGLFWLRGEQS